ncbi:MAG: hypothetical protein WB816_19630 [Methylocystis sp.]
MVRRTAKILGAAATLVLVLGSAPRANAKEGAPGFMPFFRGRQEVPAPAPEGRGREGGPAAECFSVAQTRQKIVQHRLVEPFLLMRAESAANQADALSTRLCRNGESFVYEMDLLRRDGRVIKVFIDAASGKPLPPHPEHSSHPEH